MANSAKRDSTKAAQAEKAKMALSLRRAGASYEQIAKQLGYRDGAGAFKLIKNAIAAIPKEEVEAVRELELSRCDTMLMGIWGKAKEGDLDAIDRVLRIQKRRAEYLGLDAPKKQEHTGAEGGPIEVSSAIHVFLPSESE